jgi:NTP pyrophosphatase (non-canonical NTP hydrolase)
MKSRNLKPKLYKGDIMNHKEYTKLAKKTENDDQSYWEAIDRAEVMEDDIHDNLENCLNTSYDLEQLKKHIFYGKDAERLNSATMRKNYLTAEAIACKIDNRALHAVLGMIGELGEIIEAIASGDKELLIKELGDFSWYQAILMDHTETSMEEVYDRNIAKLKARYGDKFSSEKAINKDETQE